MVKRSVEEWVRFFVIHFTTDWNGPFPLRNLFPSSLQLEPFGQIHQTRTSWVAQPHRLSFHHFIPEKITLFRNWSYPYFFLTGSALLVFGQIYQTGADVYDLFFGLVGTHTSLNSSFAIGCSDRSMDDPLCCYCLFVFRASRGKWISCFI